MWFANQLVVAELPTEQFCTRQSPVVNCEELNPMKQEHKSYMVLIELFIGDSIMYKFVMNRAKMFTLISNY